jgi:hypothetical protein
MLLNKKTLAFAATAAAVLFGSLATPSAHAASFNFSGNVNYSAGSPSLLGETISGQFSYSDAAAALGGPDGAPELLSLDFNFLGQTYHLSQATDAYAQFESGVLVGPNAGFTLGASTLQLQSFFGASGFTYTAGVASLTPLGASTASVI